MAEYKSIGLAYIIYGFLMILTLLYGYLNISPTLEGSELFATVMGVNTGYLGYLVMLAMIVAGAYAVTLYNKVGEFLLPLGGALLALGGFLYFIATFITGITEITNVVTMLAFIIHGIGLVNLSLKLDCKSLYASGIILFFAGIFAMTTAGTILIIFGTIMAGFAIYKQ